MADFPAETTENGEMATVMENFPKKGTAVVPRPQITSTSAAQVSASGESLGHALAMDATRQTRDVCGGVGGGVCATVVPRG
jgi:hypothetical protein